MAKKHFNILMENAHDEEEYVLKNYYKVWRDYNKGNREPFFPIFNVFKEKHLKELEAGPLKLYLYFGFHADNQYGHNWHSIETIAGFFKTQPRTINNWIKKLIDAGLIHRDRKGKKSNTTYLIPYSTTLIRLKSPIVNQEETSESVDVLTEIVKKYKHIYGNIIGVYHLFQWKTKIKDKRKFPKRNGNTQWIFILSQRDNGVVTALFYPLQHFSDYGVSKLYIEDHQMFKSPFKFESKPIWGLALNHELQIDDPDRGEAVSELVEDLGRIDSKFFEQRAGSLLEYGRTDEVLEEAVEESRDTINEENG